MSDQKPLSTDPHEGLASVTPPADTGPKMSAAKPQLAFGQTEIAFPDRPSPEVTREDNSLFGMPPEVAVLSGLAVGRAMGVAGLTAAGRAVAGLKAAAGQAAPVLKYEVVKHALQAVGISPALATAGAMAISSYKKGAPPASEAEAIATGPHMDRSVPVQAGSLTAEQLAQRIKQPGSITEEARARFEAAKAARKGPVGVTAQPPATEPIAPPAQASPAAAMLQVQPAATPTAPVMPIGERLNVFMRAARKAGVTLSADDILGLNKAVREGADPNAAVGALIAQKSPVAAVAQMPGVMTDAEVQAALDARNARGQIKTPSAQTARARRAGVQP